MNIHRVAFTKTLCEENIAVLSIFYRETRTSASDSPYGPSGPLWCNGALQGRLEPLNVEML